MNIQSLSIVVPTNNSCVNKCKFCVSRTHTNPYEDKISSFIKGYFNAENNNIHFNKKIKMDTSRDYKDYRNRLQYARDNGCNVVVLTGTGEPVQNKKFLDFFYDVNETLDTPFKSIEIQTTGVLLDEEYLLHLREIGITTISFSISNIFDNDRNLELIDCAEKLKFNVFDIIKIVKKYGFNLRLSLNLVNDYDQYRVREVIDKCEELGADQVTFRKLYKSKLNNEIDEWIENNASIDFYDRLTSYVKTNGLLLGQLPFGPKMYDIQDMSIVIDQDCMSEEIKDTYKYLILRENAKLYTNWSKKSSLVF